MPVYTIDPQACLLNLVLIVLGLKESEHTAISNFSSTAFVELENALAQYVRKSSQASIEVRITSVGTLYSGHADVTFCLQIDGFVISPEVVLKSFINAQEINTYPVISVTAASVTTPSSSNLPVIVGAGVGGTLSVLLLILLVAICIRRGSGRRKRDQVEVRGIVSFCHTLKYCHF